MSKKPARKLLTPEQTAAKVEKFKATMAAKRARGETSVQRPRTPIEPEPAGEEFPLDHPLFEPPPTRGAKSTAKVTSRVIALLTLKVDKREIIMPVEDARVVYKALKHLFEDA